MEILETHITDMEFRHNSHTAIITLVSSPGFYHVQRTNIIAGQVNDYSHNLVSCPKGDTKDQEARAYEDAYKFFEDIKRNGLSEGRALAMKDEYWAKRRKRHKQGNRAMQPA